VTERAAVNWAAAQVWLRWAGGQLDPALARLSARRGELAIGLLLALFFLLAGGLSLRAAVIGLALVAAWAALWPQEDGGGGYADTLRQQTHGADQLWRSLVDGFPEPALVLSASGHIVHANALAEDLFGGRRRGGHIAAMSRDPELLAAIDAALASGVAAAVELHERVPMERRRLATVAPIGQRGAAAGDPALLITLRDLTEQDRLARMRADFVANASHELRTPLASLKGFVETLQGAAKDDSQARERFLKVMSEQAERMTRLIDDLLSLSRVEMREHIPPSARVDLNEAAAHVLQALQPISEQAGTTIRLTPLAGDAIVRGDRDELVQVFQNLIQNAIKYGKRGGQIDVRVARAGARLVVSITDDGLGIAPEHLPRLTERFYRVSVAESREKGGTGLGLAIVKHILNRHRGELGVSSQVGQGSTFSISLPAAAS
jgi:two-component system phosphate regulon sensor histidine kinase PhoR